MKNSALLLTLTATLLAACTTAPTTPPDPPVTWQSINRAIVVQHIIPRYRQLADASRVLEQEAHAMCTAPDAARLESLRAGFNTTMDAWMGIQHIRNGPVELFTRYHRFELWPDKHNTGPKQLGALLAAEDATALEPENFAHSSVAVQGLTALERLLFDEDTSPSSFGTPGAPNYRCRVIEAIAHNLATMSTDLVEDWNPEEPPYAMLFISTSQHLDEQPSNQELEAKREVSATFFNNMNTQVQSIIDQKMLRAMGERAEDAKPRMAESWRSHRSLRNITLNLHAVQSIYETGFAPLLRSKQDGADLDKKIAAAFQASLSAAAAIAPGAGDVFEDANNRAGLEKLLSANRALLSLLTGPLPQALDIPFSFNALDGD
ncbi:MAG: imelysin family protein [Pseudomonadota bacterium]